MIKSVNGLDKTRWDKTVLTRSHKLSIKRETFKSKNRNDFYKLVSNRIFFYKSLVPTWNV